MTPATDPLDEFHRLADAFDVMDECAYLGHDDPERFGGARLGPLDRARAMAWLAEGKATRREVLSGMREALGDLSLGLADLLRRDPERARSVLNAYRNATGRDYWSDAGHPKRMLKAILKHGAITDETEYRLVKEYVSTVGEKVLTGAEREKATVMLGDFESRIS